MSRATGDAWINATGELRRLVGGSAGGILEADIVLATDLVLSRRCRVRR